MLTRAYYAEWLDVEPALWEEAGLFFVCSPKRDVPQAGYPQRFDLYILHTGTTCIVSYSRRLENEISLLKQEMTGLPSVSELSGQISKRFGGRIKMGNKYRFTSLPGNVDFSVAFPLQSGDYTDYYAFFTAVHPNANPEEWLPEYFAEMVKEGYCWGIKQDGRLITVTDAPELPYLKDQVVELGIHTLPSYRGQGFAKKAAAACVNDIERAGKTPLWSCVESNHASIALAESLGFALFAKEISVSIP